MSQQTVTINGVKYDAHTGMRTDVSAPSTPAHQSGETAQSIHASTQRSQTLNRKFVKKQAAASTTPVPAVTSKSAIVHTEAPKAAVLHRKQIHIQSSPHTISKFAAHPTTKKPTPTVMDIAPQAHPMVNRAHSEIRTRQAAQKASQQPIQAPARAVKQHVVSETLAQAPSHHANTKPIKQKSGSKMPRILSIVSASAALLLLAGYFTYINMPNLSVRVAAAQAGINATYPSYRPDGYSLNGPIAYNSGQVSMKFAYNSGSQNFTVTQSRSNWDSSAVDQNYAQAKWGNDVATTVDHGLTIYSHGSDAAWVNGGILYTISGNAPLSSQQVLNIATSM